MPKKGSHCVCLQLKLIDSVLKVGKNYFRQVFLEICKHVVKEKMLKNVLLMM